jgi:hypothetical protein
MGGWFVDIFVGYFIRVAIRSMKVLRARTWPPAKASVMSSNCTQHAYGGDYAEVFYKYYVDGVSYADVHNKAFLLPSSAKFYANQFVPGSEISIRVKPGNPAVSIACI